MRRPWLALILLAPLLPCAAALMHSVGWIRSDGVFAAVMVMVVILDVVVILAVLLTGHPGKRATTPLDPADVLYADGLITIGKDRLIFHHYGPIGAREVMLSDVHAVRALPPTLRNGKYRISGSGDMTTWFPWDWKRSSRDTIFVTELKQTGAWRIGFTVKDSARVRTLLRQLGVLHPICPKCGYDLRASKDRCPECGAAIG